MLAARVPVNLESNDAGRRYPSTGDVGSGNVMSQSFGSCVVLGNDIFNYMPMDISQSHVSATKTKGASGVVDAQ